MAGLLDLFSGRSSDIYGEGLLSPEQRGGLGNIGLLALAGKLGQLAGPSFSPVPDFGAALGQAAGAYGASQEGAGTAALNAILTGQKGRKLQQELEFGKQLQGNLPELMRVMAGLGSGGGEGSGSTGGAAVSPGAGGGGGDISDPLALIEKYESGGRNIMQGVVPPGGGYNPSVGRVTGPSSAGGYWQIIDPTWRENAPKVGVDLAKYPTAISAPREVQKAVAQKLYDEQGFAPWAPYNPALAAAIRAGGGGRAAAAPTAAAPAGGGGLLNLPQVPQFSRDQFGLPQGGGNAPTVPLQQLLNKARQDFGEGSGSSAAAPEDIYGGTDTPPGFAARQLVAQLGARPPLDDASQYQQVAGPGGGEPPGGMASGLLAPGGPLTRGGVPGLPAMPAAAPPSADPSSQLGPLAPAPAAAAPAAAGPGLLSPPGAPAAAALPRGANPAYGNVSNLLGILGVQAEAAGLKNVFAPLADAFRQSPAFQAQLETARRAAGLPFTQAEDLFKKQVEIAGVGPIEAAKLPYALAQKYFEAEQQIRVAGPVASAQNFERIRADNAAKGIITTKDADGQIRLSIDPDAVKAVTRATITAPKQAEADIARETKRIEQEQAARYEPMPGGVPVMGADGKTTMMPMSRYEYDLRKRLEAERRGAGGSSSGPQPGDIVGTPYVSKEEEQSREIDLKTLESKRATAEGARLAIQNANDVQDLIAKGVVMGPGESVRSGLLKLGYALKLTGKDENDLIANTEAFISRQGSELKDALKGLGPPISNIDVQTAGGIAGGKNLTVQGLQELMRIKEKYHRQALTDYNDMAAQAPPGRFDRTIKEPPTYGAKTATGPNGQRMWEKSPGNWVAF